MEAKALTLILALACTAACGLCRIPFEGDPLEAAITSGYSQDINANWCFPTFLYPHEAFRRDLAFGERALRPEHFADGAVAWKWQAFFKWARYTLHLLHGHHWAEEEVFFPGMVEKGVSWPPRVAADHQSIMAQVDEILGLESRFAAAEGKGQLQELAADLRTRWLAFQEDMLPHLQEEERLCENVVEAITPADMDELVGEIIAKLPAEHLFSEVAHFSYWCEKWGRDTFYPVISSQIPPPVRFITWAFFQERDLDYLRLLESIERDEPFVYPDGIRTSDVLVLLPVAAVLLLALFASYRCLRCVLSRNSGGAAAKGEKKGDKRAKGASQKRKVQ